MDTDKEARRLSDRERAACLRVVEAAGRVCDCAVDTGRGWLVLERALAELQAAVDAWEGRAVASSEQRVTSKGKGPGMEDDA